MHSAGALPSIYFASTLKASGFSFFRISKVALAKKLDMHYAALYAQLIPYDNQNKKTRLQPETKKRLMTMFSEMKHKLSGV